MTQIFIRTIEFSIVSICALHVLQFAKQDRVILVAFNEIFNSKNWVFFSEFGKMGSSSLLVRDSNFVILFRF